MSINCTDFSQGLNPPSSTLGGADTQSAPKKDPPKPEWFDKWENFRDNVVVGSFFSYLGVQMVVTEIVEPYVAYGVFWDAGIVCEYLSLSGDFKTKEFRAELLYGHFRELFGFEFSVNHE